MRTRTAMVVLSLAACSASEPVSVEDFSTQARQATCEFQVRCGGAADMAACLAVLPSAPPLSATYLAAVKAGRIHYDGQLVRDCLDALGSRSCDATTASYRGVPAACLADVTGTLHGGDACSDSGECISQNCAKPVCDMACCAGTCQGDDAPALAQVGASCATNPCEAEAFCDITSATCMPLKQLGETCDPGSLSCADGLACLLASGTCGTLPALGQPCTQGCRDRGTHCSLTTRTCVQQGVLGDPCDEPDDCSILYSCGADLTCSAGLALGSSCMRLDPCAGVGSFCDIPDNAATGVCSAPKANGASCRESFQCSSYVCDPAAKQCVADVACD